MMGKLNIHNAAKYALAILLLISSHIAMAAYSFPAVSGAPLPPGCSGTNGIYTCTSGLNNAGHSINIDNTAQAVTITITGNMAVNENITVSSATQALTLHISGNLTVGGYGVAGNLANSATNVALFVGGSVSITSSTIKGSIYTTGNGNITFGSPSIIPFTSGSLETNNGTISIYGPVSGCVKSSRGAAGDILLGNIHAGVGGVNCASGSATSCVNNSSGRPMPALCKQPVRIANYLLDESSWNGTANETKDTAGFTGGPFDGQGTGSPLPTANPFTANPARAGNIGTCGYASFSGSTSGGSAFTLDNLPVSTIPGNRTTVSFWMYWNGTNYVQPIGWNQYNLFFSDGFFGFNTGAYDIWGINSNGLTNGWHHVVAVFTNGNVASSKLYINGNLQTLTQIRSAEIVNRNSYAQSLLYLSGWAFDNSWRFVGGRIDEVKVYNHEISQAQVTADFNETHTCLANIIPANFNCTVVGGTSNTGRLFTQLAGTNFNVDVIALKSDGAVETSYVATGTKNVTLEFVDGSGTTACGSRAVLNPAVSQTVTFAPTDQGRKTVSNINISRAYRDLRCRVTDANQSPSVVGCSSDNFAVRPNGFTVTSTNANANSAGTSTTATPVIKAGASFNLTANAGVLGYDGTPIIDTTRINAHAGALQVGNVSGLFSAANATTGIAVGSGFNYSEVGYFNFAANGVYDNTFTSVDAGAGDCVTGFAASGGRYGCSFGNTTASNFFGRFIPDHFSIAAGANTEGCDSGNFTYFGQDGLATAFTLRAENTSNQTTQNYTGTYAKLGLNTWSNFNFSASPLPTGTSISASSTAPTGAWLNGSANITAKHLVSRPTAVASPTNMTIRAAPTDSDGVTIASTAVSAASAFRFGRLLMPNTYGSELLPLTIPIEAQYWNGSAYQRNQQDNCTVIAANTIAMGNYRNNLAACETQLSGAGAFSAGVSTATLTKPGAGNSGSVDLTVNLNGASGNTCNSASSSSAGNANMPWFGNNPNARATFGIFKTPMIYMRENF